MREEEVTRPKPGVFASALRATCVCTLMALAPARWGSGDSPAVIKVPSETGRAPLRSLQAVVVLVGDTEDLDFDRRSVEKAVREQLQRCKGPIPLSVDEAPDRPILYVALDAKAETDRTLFAVTLEVLEKVEIGRLAGTKLDAAVWEHTELGTAADRADATPAVVSAALRAVAAFANEHAAANGRPRDACTP